MCLTSATELVPVNAYVETVVPLPFTIVQFVAVKFTFTAVPTVKLLTLIVNVYVFIVAVAVNVKLPAPIVIVWFFVASVAVYPLGNVVGFAVHLDHV